LEVKICENSDPFVQQAMIYKLTKQLIMCYIYGFAWTYGCGFIWCNCFQTSIPIMQSWDVQCISDKW